MKKLTLLLCFLMAAPLVAEDKVADTKEVKKENAKAEKPTVLDLPQMKTLLLRGDYQNFFKNLKLIPAADRTSDEFRRLSLQAQLETGKYQDAEKDIKAQAFIHDDEAYYLSIQILIRRGAFDEALKLAEEGAQKYPESHALLFAKMNIAALSGNENLERDTWAVVKKYFSKNGRKGTAKQKYYLARSAIQRSPKMAYTLFQRAYKDDKSFIDGYVWAGFHCADKYAWRFALEEFGKALKINPNHALANAGTAYVYMEKGDYQKARNLLAKALESNSNCSMAIQLKAIILGVDEKKEEALALLKEGYKNNPKDLDILAQIAAVYEQMNKAEKRDMVIQDALKINSKFSDIFIAISQACENRRQFPQAVTWARKAIETNSRDWEGYFIAGMNLLRLGEETEGYKILERAARYNAFNVWAFNMLTLLDKDFKKKEYKLFETEHFVVKLHRSESDVLWPYMKNVVEEAYTKFAKKYNIVPKGPKEHNGKILLLMFNRHADFSARTVGLPGLGALGACFGQIITMPSPIMGKGDDKRKFNWRRVFEHEFVHVLTLQASSYNVPRWFTEGISTMEEEDPQGEIDRQLKWAWTNDKLFKLEDLNTGFSRQSYPNQIGVSYYHASIICNYIRETYGFECIGKMLTLLSEGKNNVEALEGATGKSLQVLNKEVKKYVDAFIKTIPLSAPLDDKALVALELKNKTFGLDTDGKLKLASAYIQKGNNEEARNLVNAILTKRADSVRANAMLGYLQYKVDNKPKMAQLSFNKALFVQADHYASNIYMAEIAMTNKDTAAAVNFYENALKAYPRCEDPAKNLFYKLADLYEQIGDKDKSLDTLRRNCLYNNKSYDAFIRYAERLKSLKKHKEAAQAYLESIYIYPFDAKVHKLRGELLLKIQNYTEAGSEFKVAVELEPRDREAMEQLLACHIKLKETDEAQNLLKKLRRFFPDGDYDAQEKVLDEL